MTKKLDLNKLNFGKFNADDLIIVSSAKICIPPLKKDETCFLASGGPAMRIVDINEPIITVIIYNKDKTYYKLTFNRACLVRNLE